MALAPEVVLARIEARIATLRREAAELMYELTAAQTEATIQAHLERAAQIMKHQAPNPPPTRARAGSRPTPACEAVTSLAALACWPLRERPAPSPTTSNSDEH